jgi:hypothetical protein
MHVTLDHDHGTVYRFILDVDGAEYCGTVEIHPHDDGHDFLDVVDYDEETPADWEDYEPLIIDAAYAKHRKDAEK